MTRYEFVDSMPKALDQMFLEGFILVQPNAVPTPIAQVGAVDVLPSDWAYPAVVSLMEDYGVNLVYPDRTFRGNRALTAGQCIEYLNSILASNLQLSDLSPYLKIDPSISTFEEQPVPRGTFAVFLLRSLQEARDRGALFRE